MPLPLTEYRAARPAVVTLGTFDGVHRGHQALLHRAQQRARAEQGPSLAFTFSQPPGNFLGYSKPLLLEPALKYRLLERFVTLAVVAEFPQVAWMSPEHFVTAVLARQLRAQGVVVGPDYRFGQARAGDVATLRAAGERHGFEVFVVPPVRAEGRTVSSTRIRQAVRAGQVELATRLLGRPPLLRGTVVPGQGLGRQLGYPTANLRLVVPYVTPTQGIFAGWAYGRARPQPAAIYFGSRPTFADPSRAIEVHLLEGAFPDLYGEQLGVHLVKKLRDDRSFPSEEELRRQIERDVQRARESLHKLPPTASFAG